MKILLKTAVDQGWKEVKEGFNDELFLKLNPPLPKVKILRFDGSNKGDTVSMELNFILWKDHWTSLITDSSESEKGFDFIDEGIQLPFPFKKWRHHHKVEAKEEGSVIIDDIQYGTGLLLLDVLIYPLLYLQFLYRKPVYRKVFGKPNFK